MMKTYLVGGAVRDLLLGKEPADKDYVVVGATPDDMLAQGFSQVGADFPVFLHPQTGDEYALARVERKTGDGYHGFEVVTSREVSLEDDLLRRDLTINAMAMEVDHATGIVVSDLVDPFGGVTDLQHQLLRPVSKAFEEDPLRVLRAARFTAKLGFTFTDELFNVCSQMIARGDLNHLTQERVWQETYKALALHKPHAYFNNLYELGAFCYVPSLKMFDHLAKVEFSKILTSAMAVDDDIFADVVLGMMINLTEFDGPLVKGLNKLALKVAALNLEDWLATMPEEIYTKLVQANAFRNGWHVLNAFLTTKHVHLKKQYTDWFNAATKVTAAQFPNLTGKELGKAITAGRIEAIAQVGNHG